MGWRWPHGTAGRPDQPGRAWRRLQTYGATRTRRRLQRVEHAQVRLRVLVRELRLLALQDARAHMVQHQRVLVGAGNLDPFILPTPADQQYRRIFFRLERPRERDRSLGADDLAELTVRQAQPAIEQRRPRREGQQP